MWSAGLPRIATSMNIDDVRTLSCWWGGHTVNVCAVMRVSLRRADVVFRATVPIHHMAHELRAQFCRLDTSCMCCTRAQRGNPRRVAWQRSENVDRLSQQRRAHNGNYTRTDRVWWPYIMVATARNNLKVIVHHQVAIVEIFKHTDFANIFLSFRPMNILNMCSLKDNINVATHPHKYQHKF